MTRIDQPVSTQLILIVGISGAALGCASEASPPGGEREGTVVLPGTTGSGASSSAGMPTYTPSTTNPSGQTSASGVSSAGSGATGNSGKGDSGGITGSSGGSKAPGGPTNTSGISPSGVGPTGSTTGDPDAGETNSDLTSDTATPSSKGGGDHSGGEFSGTCTASAGAGQNASGSGPHDVVIETNSEDGIKCGTIYRPADLGGAEKYPILVWGEGGCSQDGFSNRAAMAEIASWGYFVVADGTPGAENSCQGRQNGEAFLDYITWAIAENDKPCSAYYQSLATTKIAADGFSCGGLMAENVAGDPRFAAIGITSSGLMSANNDLWDSMHAPFKIMNGGSSDIAYQNGLNDFDAVSARGIPTLYFSKTSAGHGGDLGQGRGDFNLVNLAWLNWQLKGDEGQTGKAYLIGPTCAFCNDPGWDFKSANIE